MKLEQSCLQPFREGLRQEPPAVRLALLRELVVSEIEHLGYEVAPVLEGSSVASIFILANTTGDNLRRIEELLPAGSTCGRAQTCPD